MQDGLKLSDYTRDNFLFEGNNTATCFNFTDATIWGKENFGKGAKIEIRLDYCKQELAPDGVKCKEVPEILAWFHDNSLQIFGAYTNKYVAFKDFDSPIHNQLTDLFLYEPITPFYDEFSYQLSVNVLQTLDDIG